MLKLFRKISQNLLAQGRAAHCLTYAVGEIVLVVIGIARRCPHPLQGRAHAQPNEPTRIINAILRADSPLGDEGTRGN